MTPLALPFPDIGPDLCSIEIGTFTFALRWYALAYIVGILIGWRLCIEAVRRPALWAPIGAPMSKEQIDDLVTWIILSVIVGGRLGFVIFYQPAHYLSNPLEILMVWQGGMSFNGGFLGVAVDCLIFCLRNGITLNPTADLLALAPPPGLLLGRLANFINNELWGRPTDAPWAIVFPGQAAQTCPGRTGICARHPSQIYEALLEGLVLGCVLLFLAWRQGALKRPGLLTGVFLAGYGSARAFVELFRQSDAQFLSPENPIGYAIQFGEWGLTMGQILSLPMVIVGTAIIWTAAVTRPPTDHSLTAKSH